MEADRDVLARYLDGDEKAFEELVIRYEAGVRNLVYGLLRDRALAEDVAQETFLAAYRKADTYRGEGTLRGWLFRIAIRRAHDELRRRGRKAEVDLEEAHEPSETPHEGLDAGWDLSEGLASLSPDHRAALMLKEVEGLSYPLDSRSIGTAVTQAQQRASPYRPSANGQAGDPDFMNHPCVPRNERSGTILECPRQRAYRARLERRRSRICVRF